MANLSYEELLKSFADRKAKLNVDQVGAELDNNAQSAMQANLAEPQSALPMEQLPAAFNPKSAIPYEGLSDALDSRKVQRLPAVENSDARDVLSAYAKSAKPEMASTEAQNTEESSPQVLTPQLEDEELRGAQKTDALINMLFGSSAAGDKLIEAVSNGQIKAGPAAASENPLTDRLLQRRSASKDLLNQKQKREEQDPKSAKSKDLRSLLQKQSGSAISENLSYHDLTQTSLGSTLINNETRNRAIEARLEGAERTAALRQVLTPYQEEALKIKNRQVDSSELRRLDQAKKLASGGGPAINQARVRITGADNMFDTVGIDPNSDEKAIEAILPSVLNKIKRTQVVEMAMELNKQLTTSGTPAQATLEKLVPHNVQMDETKFKDYVTSKMNDANQDDFIKQALKIAARTGRSAKETVKGHVRKSLSGLSDLRKSYPQQYEEIMRNNKLNPADDVFGGAPEAAQKTVSKGQLTAYSKQHNVSEEAARKLLAGAGYNVE